MQGVFQVKSGCYHTMVQCSKKGVKIGNFDQKRGVFRWENRGGRGEGGVAGI